MATITEGAKLSFEDMAKTVPIGFQLELGGIYQSRDGKSTARVICMDAKESDGQTRILALLLREGATEEMVCKYSPDGKLDLWGANIGKWDLFPMPKKGHDWKRDDLISSSALFNPPQLGYVHSVNLAAQEVYVYQNGRTSRTTRPDTTQQVDCWKIHHCTLVEAK